MGPTTRKHLLDSGMTLNDKWEILEHIASGGKGEVYRARQTNLDREVVVKTISIEYLAEFGDDPQEVETELNRFHREAMAMAQIRHPHVVQVYDQDSAVITKEGEELTVHYVVMEYIDGPTLRITMPDAGFHDNEKKICDWIRDYFIPVLEGIEPIHSLGIVHRDIKPENILLDGSVPKITDFGIAGGVRWPELTRSYHVEGTITYMAPEQFMDLAETDERGDVYALGKILYEVIEGRMVDSKTACPLKGVCLSNAVTPFLKKLDVVIQRATAENKEERIPCVKDFREELENIICEAEECQRPLFKGLQRREIFVLGYILGFIVVVFVASHIYHHIFMEEEFAPRGTLHSDLNPKEAAPTKPIVGKDGLLMRLVPGGLVKAPSYLGPKTQDSFQIAPFYMDETQVTNLKYIEFLNQEISKIVVQGNEIIGNGMQWARLGPVYGTYEPIIFENGRFVLSDPSYGSYPVVNVTAIGASAYAQFYGEKLPTEFQWFQAVVAGADNKKTAGQNQLSPSSGSSDLETEMQNWMGGYADQASGPGKSSFIRGHSQVPYPVLMTEPNSLEIRGLNANVSEWGIRSRLAKDSREQYVVLGGLRGSMVKDDVLMPGVAQDPTGAFVDVGFRCVVDPK